MADSGPTTRRDLILLTALALGLRLPAFLASAHLTFDDGVFGASAAAMRSGGVPRGAHQYCMLLLTTSMPDSLAVGTWGIAEFRCGSKKLR